MAREKAEFERETPREKGLVSEGQRWRVYFVYTTQWETSHPAVRRVFFSFPLDENSLANSDLSCTRTIKKQITECNLLP